MRKTYANMRLRSVGPHELQCANTAQTLRKHCANNAQTCVNMRKHFFLRMFAHTSLHAQTLRKHCANIAQTCANIAQTMCAQFQVGGHWPPTLNELCKRKHCANIAQICVNVVFAHASSCELLSSFNFVCADPCANLRKHVFCSV